MPEFAAEIDIDPDEFVSECSSSEIKRLIKEAPKLSHLDTSHPIHMECDASLTGAGSIIYHIYDNPDGTKTKNIVR